MLPALSYLSVPKENPFFDYHETPADVGAIAECFRRTPGVARSLHPTHSCCSIGARAEHLLAGHDLDSTPCGSHSPFAKLPMQPSKLLMLGCGLAPNTSMHAIEETVEPDYLFGPTVNYTLTSARGERLRKPYRTHGFSGWNQRYERVGRIMPQSKIQEGMALNAHSFILDLPTLWEVASAVLQHDPHAFVSPAGNDPKG